MRIEARIGGEERTFDFEREGERLRGRIGNRELEAEVIEAAPLLLNLRMGSRVFHLSYSLEGRRLLLDAGGGEIEVEILDPLRSTAVAPEARGLPGRREVMTAMPGKVVAVKVKVGDEVLSGQGLAVVEAMKMENEVVSPKDGRVVAVEVVEGQTVEAGALLVAVE
jgi:acetyl/propionyl-CoA carboxylase alpha subunit